MPDFNPNEMDALFRDGAERHEFEYNPDAWVLMEEKLDKKAKRRKAFFYLLGLLLIIAAIVTYSLFQVDNNNHTEIATSIPSSSVKTQIEINSENSEKIQKEQAENKTLIAPLKSTKEYISTDSKESGSNIGAQHSFQSENTGNLMGHEIVSIDSQKDLLNNEELEEDTPIQTEDKHSNISQIEKKINLSRGLVEIPFLINKRILFVETSKIDLETLKMQPAPLNPVKPDSQLSNRWAVTAFANPEWSSVGLFKESKAGWSVGGKIGYQFSNKFELSAGIAYSRKIYKGGGTAYTMAGGWYDNIEPMQMDAKCDVIEIPIGLSYYLNGFRKSGFFADIGINSYMLHSEWYGFEYDDALIRPDRYMEVIEESQNSHLIGVGRIAIGYQKVISKNTSFQVAPYLQFPLTGIGAGQVNVYSSGVQLAVKFNTQ